MADTNDQKGKSKAAKSDLSGAVALLAATLAAQVAIDSCPIHERCGGCERLKPSLPVVGSSIYEVTFGKPGAISDARPQRDVEWLHSQRPPFLRYEHRPIDSAAGEIRLLRVQPAIYRADVLDCDLLTFNLNDCPGFDALSYVWGAPVFDHEILCENRIMFITKSLDGALKRFRRLKKSKQQFIWVDAICINQQDKIELTQQLMHIRRIYQTATTVRVDISSDKIGEWSAGYQLMQILDFAEQEGIKAYLEEAQVHLQRSETTLTARQQIIQRYNLPDLRHSSWQTFGELFASPWFTRTWTLQELILAREPEVFVDCFTFSWKNLVRVMQIYILLYPRIVKGGQWPSMAVRTGFGNYMKIINLVAWYARERSFVAPLYAVLQAKDFEASDPRDKIIAMLIMIDEKPVGTVQPFKPDYTVSVDVLYHRFSIHLSDIENGQPLLNFAGLHRRKVLPSDGTPSWVIDWTALARTECIAFFATVRPQPFRASRLLPYSGVLAANGPETEPDVLIVSGTKVDTIYAATKSLRTWDFDDVPWIEQQRATLDWICEARSLLEEPEYHNSRFENGKSRPPGLLSELPANHYHPNIEEAFARTLILDDTYTGENAIAQSTPISDPPQALRLVLAQFIEPRQQHKNPFLRLFQSLILTYMEQLMTVCQRRKFAVLQSGRIALVPECAVPGDQIVLIHGATIPFVTRPAGQLFRLEETTNLVTCYRLVGDAYVHGIMDGEALDLGLPTEKIWLQ